MELTKTYENIIGKKITQEQIDIVEKEGFIEFSRTPIKGGHEITYGKMKSGLLNGKKVRVFLLDKMPDDEVINTEFPVQENATFLVHGSQGEKYVGTYGMANSRKFFCIGKTKSKASDDEPKQPAADKKSGNK